LPAVLPVHLGGRMVELGEIAALARARSAAVVEDAAHGVGSADMEGRAGDNGRSDFACFSLHPVKTIAAGEGGMVTAGDGEAAARMRRLANQGVTRDSMRDRALSFDGEGRPNPWSYEQVELGLNVRMDEMSAALGLSQLGKLARFKTRRAALAARYAASLADLAPVVRTVTAARGQSPCLHLLQVLIDFEAAGVDRATLMRRMEAAGVGTQVHYAPVYRQPYFRERYGEQRLTGAEAFYARVLALPLFPAMTDADVDRAVESLRAALRV
jgi:dTDP-4-amino-4,6-dideoxygalactose transaminase